MEKKKMTNKKKFWIGMSSLAAIGVITATVAYFSTYNKFDNNIKSQSAKVTVMHALDKEKAEKMVPGQTENLDIGIENEGDTPVLARIKYVALNDGEEFNNLSFGFEKNKPGIEVTDADRDILFNADETNGTNFLFGSDGYYYYNNVIAKSDGEIKHIDSVTFNEEYVATKQSDETGWLLKGSETWVTDNKPTDGTIVGTKYTSEINVSNNIVAVVETIQATNDAGEELKVPEGATADTFKEYWGNLGKGGLNS